MEHYAKWIIRWRYVVIAISLLLVCLLTSGGQFLSFKNDYRVFFGKDNPELQAFENLQATYSKTDNLLFMLEPKDGQVFTPTTLQAVVDLTAAAWQLPYSTRVDSISNFQYSYADGDNVTITRLITNPQQLNNVEINAIKAYALTEPLLVRRLISPQGHVTGINVTIQLPGKNSTTEIPSVVKPARALVADIEARYPNIKVYLTGVVMMNNAFSEATLNDFRLLQPLAFVTIMVGLLIFLRSLACTIITLLMVVLLITSAMGTAGWLGIQLTPPSASAPTIILILAVADCVHILVTFLHQLRQGKTKDAAIIESLRINFHPILLTSLTTIVGFLSLNFSDAPPFHDLGNITAIGIVYAFLLTVTLLPALLAIIPMQSSVRKEMEHRLINQLAEFVIRHRRPLPWIMGVLMVLAAACIPLNDFNDLFVEYFDHSVKFRRDTDYVTQQLTGLYFIDYSLAGQQDNTVSDPQFQAKVQNFIDWLQQQPEVVYTNSYTDILKRLNKNMHGDDPNMYKLPEQKELSAQYLLLYEMSLPYGLDLNNQLNLDKSATRLSVVLKTISSREILALEKRSKHWLQQNAPEIDVQSASPSLMFAHIGQRNIKSMLLGTFIALIIISFILIVALKSWKYGLISLLPNLAPAAVALGIWGLFIGQVGLAVSIVAGMSLGIVVDDTIHFLSKYMRARREQQLSAEAAVRYAFSSVGVALAITSIVLIAGFLVLSQSAFVLTADMGMVTSLTIAIALIIDFLFLPPLLMKIEANNDNSAEVYVPPQRLAA